MPFLLLDDAADEATRRLTELGQQQFSNLGSSAQGAVGGIQQGAQDLGASAQDVTQRLMQMGQQQLANLPQIQAPPAPDLDAITGRLHAFGQQQLDQATSQGQSMLNQGAQAAQQGIQQLQPLQPLAPPPSQTQPMQQQDLGATTVERGGDLHAYARQAAQRAGIDPDIFERQIQQESGFNPSAKSPAGAIGIAQFMPGTAAGRKLDPTDAYASLDAAASMDAENLAKYGNDWRKVLAAYNAGPGAVDQYGGVPPYKETQTYVSTILGDANPIQSAVSRAKDLVQQGGQAVQQGVQNLTGQPSSVFPVVGYDGAINDHWGSVKGGSDIMADRGTPVVAMRGGKVIESGWNSVGGNSVLIQAEDGNQYYYAHFDKAPSVKVGDTISAGTYLGPVGNTGDASGGPTHLHIGIGPDIKLGADKYGGTGGDYDAVDLLKQALAGQQNPPAQATSAAAGPQTLAPPTDTTQRTGLVDIAKNKVQQGITALDQSGMLQTAGDLATGGLTRRFNQNLQGLASDLTGGRQLDLNQGIKPITSAVADSLDSLAGTADQLGGGGLVPPDLMRAGAGLLRQPGVLDAQQTLEDLATKYRTHDTTQYTPDDQKAAGQAMLTAGGVLAGTDTGAADTTRMFHGTGSTFDRVEPGRMNTEGLYGPGYYLTSSPEVAGGVVQAETTPLNAMQKDLAARGLGLPQDVAGTVRSPGYAQTVSQDPAQQLRQIDTEQQAIQQFTRQLQQPDVPPTVRDYLEKLVDQARQKLGAIAGPNVRPVDVPNDLHLLDMNQPLDPADAQKVGEALWGSNGARPLRAGVDDPEALQEIASWSQPGADGQGVYDQILGEIGGNKGEANNLLAQAGFDGIQHNGGRIIPMFDATGQPIEHTVNVIFPESLDKVTNATAGTQGGQVTAPLALGAGVATGLGALAANKDQVGQSLDDLRSNFQSPVTLEDIAQNPAAQDVARNIIAPLLDRANTPVGALNDAADALNPAVTPEAPLGRGADWLSQQNVPVLSGAAELVKPLLNAPGVLDSIQTLQDLNAKYADTPGAQTVPMKGQDPLTLGVASSGMTPEDEQRYQQARATVAGITWADVGRSAQAARIGSLAGGIPTLGHIALNTPVQVGLKLASDLGANIRYPEANAAELYGAMQGLRHWGLNAATTLATPGPLARSMGGGVGPQALETGLVGLVKAHPLLQDIPRQMASQMELYRTAAQAATDAGLPRLGGAWRAEVARLVASPTADMQALAKSAGDTAALAGRMGTTGQAVADLIKKSPIARFAVPIFDIGYKVASQGVELTPLGSAGILADIGRAAIGEGPYAGKAGFAGRGAADAVTPLAQRVRNNLIGLALMYEGYQQAAQGNITGEGPADPGKQAALRQTGWQADSVKVGGRYFNAHLLGPLGWPLIDGANLFESINGPGGQGLEAVKTPQGERAPGALDMLGDMVARQGRYFNNETFLNSLGSVLNLVGARAQQGQVPASEAANVLQSLIPQGALLANLASSQDPYQRNPKAGANPLEDIQNQIASRLPDNPWTPSRSQLQPRLTATGMPMPNPQQGAGLLLPRSSVGNPDPILEAMQQTGVVPTNVPTTVPYGTAGEVQMTPAEQYTWQQYRGLALQQLASDLINSPGYKNADLTTQRNLLARINSAASAQASKFVERDIVTSPGGGLTRRMTTGKQAPVQSYEPAG